MSMVASKHDSSVTSIAGQESRHCTHSAINLGLQFKYKVITSVWLVRWLELHDINPTSLLRDGKASFSQRSNLNVVIQSWFSHVTYELEILKTDWTVKLGTNVLSILTNINARIPDVGRGRVPLPKDSLSGPPKMRRVINDPIIRSHNPHYLKRLHEI